MLKALRYEKARTSRTTDYNYKLVETHAVVSGLTVNWTDLSILRAAIHHRHIHLVESQSQTPPADDHDPLRCVQGVACFELGVRANAHVQLQGNQIGAAAKPPQSADPLSAATICRVAWF